MLEMCWKPQQNDLLGIKEALGLVIKSSYGRTIRASG